MNPAANKRIVSMSFVLFVKKYFELNKRQVYHRCHYQPYQRDNHKILYKSLVEHITRAVLNV